MPSPFFKMTDPACTSLPISLTFSPFFTSEVRISTVPSSAPSSLMEERIVSSTITTASAPGGKGAPVVILAISPSFNSPRSTA
jgi:hypothetical protein